MTRIDRDGEKFIVPAARLAVAFKMTEDAVHLVMRDTEVFALSCPTSWSQVTLMPLCGS